MDWSLIEDFSEKEVEHFRSVCNNLLGKTFVTRMIWENGAKNQNSEYSFLLKNQQAIQGYLAYLGWDLFHEQVRGYFYVTNNLEENRLVIDKEATGILLALRMIYDEDSKHAGLHQDVICDVRDLLEKVVTDFAILNQKPNMKNLKKSLQLMENHGVIARLDGRYNEIDCRFTILPTILTAVSAEKMNALVEQMKSVEEETDEEIDEILAD